MCGSCVGCREGSWGGEGVFRLVGREGSHILLPWPHRMVLKQDCLTWPKSALTLAPGLGPPQLDYNLPALWPPVKEERGIWTTQQPCRLWAPACQGGTLCVHVQALVVTSLPPTAVWEVRTTAATSCLLSGPARA